MCAVVDSQASEEDTKRREKETPYPVTPEQTQEVFLNKVSLLSSRHLSEVDST